jgi:hypothetical protein
MSIYEKITIKVNGDVLETPGIDWGRKLKILAKSKDGKHVVVRRAGYMAWNGRGEARAYDETLYMLIQLGSEKAHTRKFGTVLEELRPGRDRKAIQALITKCESL